jgi:hypothetical protein
MRKNRFTIKYTISDTPMSAADFKQAEELFAKMAARAYLQDHLKRAAIRQNTESWDGDYTLGPFFDKDGTEILPCTTEATDELLVECMGYYKIVSNLSDVHENRLLISNRRLTEYIQKNWDKVMGPDLSDGFLLAYRSAHKAVGRLAEELICVEVVRALYPKVESIKRSLTATDATRNGLLIQPTKGWRSDDLLLVIEEGDYCLVESKASFSGTSYLRRCLPKALGQLRATVALNENLKSVLIILTAIRHKHIIMARFAVDALFTVKPDELVAQARELLLN